MAYYELYGEQPLRVPTPSVVGQETRTSGTGRFYTDNLERSHGFLPGRDALAPARWRQGRALKRQGTVGAPFFHWISVPLLNGLAKDKEG